MLSKQKILWTVLFTAFFSAGTLFAEEDADVAILKKMGKAFANIAKKASPAVVYIEVDKTVKGGGTGNMPQMLEDDEFFQQFFQRRMTPGKPRNFHQKGQGSGFIISSDGRIMTNNHVVGEMDKITVKLSDGRSFEAKVLGADTHTDVAVIKIDAKDLPVLELGDSDKLEVGEWAVAVGNPFGLTSSVTAGIISAKGRTRIGTADYEDFIQTDAAINPGNSGGPLLNLDGKVIGMNTAIYSQTGGSLGIGFAIPINMAQSIAKQLTEKGRVTRGYLGVMIQDLTPDLATSLNIKESKGILVGDVIKETPAAKAGLKEGDVIRAADGKAVESVGEFRNRIAMTVPGTKVEITVLRGGEEKKIDVVVEELPKDKVAALGKEDLSDELGLTVQPLTPDLAKKFGHEDQDGVLVSDVEAGSVAAQAGLVPGVLIQEANQEKVKDVAGFSKVLTEAKKKGSLLLRVRQNGHASFVVLKFEGKK